MPKLARQAEIRRIIRSMRIATQSGLGVELEKQGHDVTLATISRDIAELGLVRKRDRSGGTVWALPEQEHLGWMLQELVGKIEVVQNTVIVKCSTGTAPGVAAAIDEMKFEEIAGTVAGDDTILMIARNDDDASSLVTRLERSG